MKTFIKYRARVISALRRLPARQHNSTLLNANRCRTRRLCFPNTRMHQALYVQLQLQKNGVPKFVNMCNPGMKDRAADPKVPRCPPKRSGSQRGKGHAPRRTPWQKFDLHIAHSLKSVLPFKSMQFRMKALKNCMHLLILKPRKHRLTLASA